MNVGRNILIWYKLLGVNDESFGVQETGAKWFTSNLQERKQKSQQNNVMKITCSREARYLKFNPRVCATKTLICSFYCDLSLQAYDAGVTD
jgi:hypothetical protein